MNLQHLPNWFDFLVLIVALLGINKGRKHGMSVELMICLQWVTIVLAAGFLYRPIGDTLAQSSSMFGHLSCYIAVYLGIALAVKLAFVLLKKGTGGKLVSSSLFGGGEYYLGMMAGAVRYVCVLMMILALLNARFYSTQEINAATAFQNDVYGSNFFPELSSVQQQVFSNSLLGDLVKKHVSFLLITPTAPEKKDLQRRKDDFTLQ
jgi:uncharacterized membrane protein required for colicin V production